MKNNIFLTATILFFCMFNISGGSDCAEPGYNEKLFHAQPTVLTPFLNGISLKIPQQVACQKQAQMGILDITQPPFNADSSGKSDSTRQIQKAINFSRDHQMVCFFPAGTYLISDTLECVQIPYRRGNGKIAGGRNYPCVLMGSRQGCRPKILLSPNSPGFGDPLNKKYVIHFRAQRKGKFKRQWESQPSISMNQMFVNIDVVIGLGNSGAVAIRNRAAQGSGIQDCTIDATHGYSGVEGGAGSGGSHSGITVIGGMIGLDLTESQPAPTLTGIRLKGQKEAAIIYQGRQCLSAVGLSISSDIQGPVIKGPQERLKPHHGQISLVDSSIVFNKPGGIAVSSSSSLYLNNVYIKGGGNLLDSNGKLPFVENGEGWTRIIEYVRGVRPRKGKGFQFEAPIIVDGKTVSSPHVKVEVVSSPPTDLVSRHLWPQNDFPSRESAGAANVKLPPYKAAGDGIHDDTQAIQRAIDENEIVFIPKGYYRITQTLELRPKTKLVGVAKHLSILIVAEPTGDFGNPELPMPLVRAADNRYAETIMAFMGIYVPRSRNGAYALLWRCGGKSIVRDVNFYYMPLHKSVKKINSHFKKNIPLVRISGYGGGRWYNFFQDTRSSEQGPGYRHLLVDSTSSPLAFYQCNPEHANSLANMEIRNAAYVSIYGLKGEEEVPILWINHSDHIYVFGYGGMAAAYEDKSLFLITNTPNFAIVNAVDTIAIREGRADPDKWHMIIEEMAGHTYKTPPLDRPVLYQRGFPQRKP